MRNFDRVCVKLLIKTMPQLSDYLIEMRSHHQAGKSFVSSAQSVPSFLNVMLI